MRKHGRVDQTGWGPALALLDTSDSIVSSYSASTVVGSVIRATAHLAVQGRRWLLRSGRTEQSFGTAAAAGLRGEEYVAGALAAGVAQGPGDYTDRDEGQGPVSAGQATRRRRPAVCSDIGACCFARSAQSAVANVPNTADVAPRIAAETVVSAAMGQSAHGRQRAARKSSTRRVSSAAASASYDGRLLSAKRCRSPG